jgi:hypothetical protein
MLALDIKKSQSGINVAWWLTPGNNSSKFKGGGFFVEGGLFVRSLEIKLV